jgi:photosystem II stability/assembly factor-like uncharacterized protein
MKKTLLFLATILSFSAFGQWEVVEGIEETNLYGLHLNPSNRLFIGSDMGKIYKQETDGTFSLSNIEKHAMLGDIEFRDNQVGYAGAGCYYVTPDCSPNTIFKTVDGGQNWELIKQIGSTGVVNSIAVVGNNKVLALSDYTDLLYSEDNGETWEIKSIDPTNAVGYYSNLFFLDENTGFLAGNQRIYKTSDSGENWSIIYGADNSISDLYSYTFVNTQLGFATHSNGQIAKTTDGGTTWTRISYSNNTEEFGLKIHFITPQIGYLTSYIRDQQTTVLYKTTDGGESWVVDFKPENSSVSDFVFLDSQNGYATANNGKLYKRSGTIIPTDEPQEITIFPNPSKEQFQIKSLDLAADTYNLRVVNTLGQVVISTDRLYEVIDIQKLMVGTYIVEVLNSQGDLVARSKLLKQP